MLVMLICMIVGAMFFRWLQDEDYMKNFGAMIGSVYRIYHWITPFYCYWIGGSAYNNN